MCDRPHRETLVPLRAFSAAAQSRKDAAQTTFRYDQLGQEREEDWRRSLDSLQEFVCELLIQNQELRMSLLASASTKPGEADQ